MCLVVLFILILRFGIGLFWIMDILNMPFMEIFDTVYPLNRWFWLLVFILFGGTSIKTK